jgi:hypothetical protein
VTMAPWPYVTSTPQLKKSGPSAMESEDASRNKQKRGQRGCNTMSSVMVYVTQLDSNGHPSQPLEARKAFKRASGFQVRDNVPITILDWQLVSATIKEKIWSNMKKKNQVFSWCRGSCEECDVH